MQMKLVALALCVVTANLFGAAAAADDETRTGKDVVLVEVNGTKVTLADLEQKRPASLFQARTNYYEAERKVIEELVDDYLLEQQAAKEKLTVDQLLDKHVNSTLPKEPSEEALRVYFEGVDTTEPYESVRGKIVDALRDRRMAKIKSAYMQSLRAQSGVVLRLAPPRAPISMSGIPTRGVPNAPVTLLEFADYECPYCQQVQPIIEKLETEFKGKIRFAYKDYPLNMHPSAQKAAEAVHCADAQGKFWEFHDTVLNKKQVDLASLKTFAKDLKLDTAAFDKCLDSGATASAVKTQLTEAQALGLQGTPSFFVNGRFVSGNLSYERLHGIIAEELSAVGGAAASAGEGANNKPQGR
jgi:protein-disulfide isomerase